MNNQLIEVIGRFIIAIVLAAVIMENPPSTIIRVVLCVILSLWVANPLMPEGLFKRKKK